MMKHRKELVRIASAVETMATVPSARPTDRPDADPERLPFTLRVRRWMQVSEARTAAAVAARRAFPIMGYVGPNGGGKSACMVADTLASLDAGRKVLSTIALLDEKGRPHPGCERFTDWDQLLEARDCDILMDEMVGIAGARESQRLDPRVQNILVQLRRRNIVLRWSAPNWARADKIVREVTQSVTECRGYFADRRVVRSGAGDAVGMWAPKRLFRWQTFDTLEFEEWSAGKREKLKPTVREWFYGPGSRVFRAYDTLDAVSMVAGIQDNGRCDICNGRIAVPSCKGHEAAEVEAFQLARREALELHTELADHDLLAV